MPEAVVRGTRLFHEQKGAGEPIICIHGGGSSALLWSDAAEALSSVGRVIAYDRRGCGRSARPQPYDRTTVAEQADDAAALLERLDAVPALVIGRSYGGAVAVELALRHPGHVRALVLLEGDALGLSPSALEWTRDLRRQLLEVRAQRGIDAVYAALVDAVAGPGVWRTWPPEIRGVLTANGPALLAELTYVDDPHPGADDLASIERPSLVVMATESPAEFREMAAALARALPQARLEVVAGGHLVDPAAPVVLDFAREVLGVRSVS